MGSARACHVQGSLAPESIGREQPYELISRGDPVADVFPPTNEHAELRIAGGLWIRQQDATSVARFVKTDPIVVHCADQLVT